MKAWQIEQLHSVVLLATSGWTKEVLVTQGGVPLDRRTTICTFGRERLWPQRATAICGKTLSHHNPSQEDD